MRLALLLASAAVRVGGHVRAAQLRAPAPPRACSRATASRGEEPVRVDAVARAPQRFWPSIVPPELVSRLERAGFERPTSIQQRAIGPVWQGPHVAPSLIHI